MTSATIWDRTRLSITLGSVALIFLTAVEALAVTTVMPVVAADLHGRELFALAFSGLLATGVVGMVAAGAWSDRRGPAGPLCAAVMTFMIGLLISGLAPDMYVFVVGRLVQGLGEGAQTVALYVLIARVYPRELHGRIFAAFAAAWVLPGMAGPFLAGAVAEFLHWRWVFLGVAVLTALAFLLVFARLRGLDLGRSEESDPAPGPRRRTVAGKLVLSMVVAASTVVAGFAAEMPSVLGWIVAFVCTALIAVAVRPLLPRGTLRARRGVPSVILMRGTVSGAFFVSEAYLPRLLIDEFAFSPTIAGLALTFAALTWWLGSAAQGRYGDRLGSTRTVLIGVPLLLVGAVVLLLVSLSQGMPWLVAIAWGISGGGMGLLYPRLTVLTLAYSTPANEGFNSSALSISESTGSAIAIAMAGLAFLTLPFAGSGFATVFAFAAALLVISTAAGLRLGDGIGDRQDGRSRPAAPPGH
ncbi:MAG: MFS transporter [Leucobacter sp.]